MRAGRGCWYEIGDGYVLVGNIKLDFLEGSKGQGKIGALATIRQSRNRGNERENVIKRELKPNRTKAGQGRPRVRQGEWHGKARRAMQGKTGPDQTRPNHQGELEKRERGTRREETGSETQDPRPHERVGGGRIRTGTREWEWGRPAARKDGPKGAWGWRRGPTRTTKRASKRAG